MSFLLFLYYSFICSFVCLFSHKNSKIAARKTRGERATGNGYVPLDRARGEGRVISLLPSLKYGQVFRPSGATSLSNVEHPRGENPRHSKTARNPGNILFNELKPDTPSDNNNRRSEVLMD